MVADGTAAAYLLSDFLNRDNRPICLENFLPRENIATLRHNRIDLECLNHFTFR
jgi:hypothetical protein